MLSKYINDEYNEEKLMIICI